MQMRAACAVICASILLTGCALPRGAALQSEITAEAQSETPQLAVYPVTRDLLPRLTNWPGTGREIAFHWLSHTHGAEDPVIRPFDQVSIAIWDNTQNSLLTSESERLVNLPDATVNGAGQIFIPYVGEIRVADRTATAARRQIQREVETIIPSAQVQVTWVGGAKSSASLVSGMAQPGSYPVSNGHTTVLNILAEAGGPADLRNPIVRLTRAGRTYRIPLQTLYERPKADTIMRGGDKLAVEADPRYFRALGAAGTEEIVQFDRAEITALDAMSMIGGLSDNTANPQAVLILREYPQTAVRTDGSGPGNARVVFAIDLTTADGLFSAGQFPITHQDTVLATESPVNSVRTVFGLVGSAFGLANAASN